MHNNDLIRPWSLSPLQWRINLARPAAGLINGSFLGLLILGGGSRLAMRLVALLAGMTPTATVEGTLALLLMGAIVGALVGMLYATVAEWLPFYWPTKGLIFSLIFATLTVALFTGELEGEAALITPWIGAPLFAALPALFFPVLAYALHRLEPQIMRRHRSVGLLWFAAFLTVLLFAFVQTLTLGEGGRIPPGISRLVEGAGVSFHAMREVLGIGGGLLGLLFCTLHLLVFWLGAQQPAVKLLSIGQLLLAGLLIRTEPLLPFLIGINAGGWGEWLAWALLALLLLLGLWYGWRAPGQRTWLVALGSFGLAFLLLWLAILLVPALQLRGWTAVQTASTVAPYLVIWLFLPIGLCWVAWKHSRAAPE